MSKPVALYLICAITAVSAQNSLSCDEQEKCSECIRQPGCIWCSSPSDSGKIHCRLETAVSSNWCPANKLIKPEQEFRILQDVNLTIGTQRQAVQIRPQRIKVQTRRGVETKISFQYAKAADYPVDLYYIMDLSASMKKHKNTLGQLGAALVSVMRNITTNFRLGFGSFVDKKILPYTSTSPLWKNYPCRDCVGTYSFRNHLSLTGNYSLFSQRVNAANISGNLDAPEGGFDALMQAIVCKGEIGWRDNARHLIVFSTDAEYHVSGDGKLAGIYEPNDGLCHMENNEYKSLEFDYPSVSYLNRVAKQDNINVIFAVTRRAYPIYQMLQANFENSVVGKLDDNSANVVDLVMDNYKRIVDSVRITDNSTATVEIKYNASCKNSIENGCTNIGPNEIIKFTATIKPLECHAGSNTHTIQIKPEGVNDVLIVDLEVMCNCDCEQPGHSDFISNSNDCHDKGNKACGVCECQKDYIGSNCQCHVGSYQNMSVESCKQDQSKPTVCSNSGKCKCGKCYCDARSDSQLIYGKYCECTNFSCNMFKGELCGGSSRGKCVCSQCECLSGWTGEDCSCRDTITTCMAPNGNGEICSGHGKCVCGECQCETDENTYSGRYCEKCETCPDQRCEELPSCVQCQLYRSGSVDEQACPTNCTEFNTTIVNEIDTEAIGKTVKICAVIDNAIVFRYAYIDKQDIVVEILKKKLHAVPFDILVVVLTVVGTIILGGFILLAIWKVAIYMYDGREYAKFLKEADTCRRVRGDNPLYKEASF